MATSIHLSKPPFKRQPCRAVYPKEAVFRRKCHLLEGVSEVAGHHSRWFTIDQHFYVTVAPHLHVAVEINRKGRYFPKYVGSRAAGIGVIFFGIVNKPVAFVFN
ncbi:MAG: hypothetical protein WKF97_19710 [Chitinophagaceae bacterium]